MKILILKEYNIECMLCSILEPNIATCLRTLECPGSNNLSIFPRGKKGCL